MEIRNRWTGEVLATVAGDTLTRADLTDADLTGANLTGADLTDADLFCANLTDADLTEISADLDEVLSHAPQEAPALLVALRDGRVDGSCYEGVCACLVGTLARARGCVYTEVPGLTPDSGRPAERWFLAIRPGDTPATSPIVRLTADLITAWIARQPATA